MNRFNVDLDGIIKKQYFFYIAFMAAPLLYLYISHLLIQQGKTIPDSPNDIIFIIFPIVSFAAGIGGIIFRRYFNSLPMIKSKETFVIDFSKESISRMIVYCAFFESIAIYGFITVVLGGDPIHLYYYVTFSLALFITFRPTKTFLKKILLHQEQLVNQDKFFVPFKSPFSRS